MIIVECIKKEAQGGLNKSDDKELLHDAYRRDWQNDIELTITELGFF